MKKLIVLISLLLAFSLFANLGEDPYKTLRGKKLTYINYFDGDNVGKITIKVKDTTFDNKSRTSIKFHNKFHIRKFLVFTYDYDSKIEVSFSDKGVVYAGAKSNIDGDKYQYFIRYNKGKLKKTNLLNNKTTKVAPFVEISLNFIFSEKMKKALTKSWRTDAVLGIETGEKEKVKVKKAGKKTIKVFGKTYNTFVTKWVKGPRTGVSYYDIKTGILIRSDVTKDGNTMVIKLKSIK